MTDTFTDHPHVRSITVCPICGGYKPRRALTCARFNHADTPHSRAIIDDYEQALAGMAQRKAAEPIRPSQPQLPADIGLFSDDALQADLVEMLTTSHEEE